MPQPRSGLRVRVVSVVADRNGPSDPRDTEVQDLQPSVVGDHQVLGLEIHVHDLFGMRRGEAVRDFDRVLDGLVHRQRSAGHPRPERLAVQELGHRIPEATLRADVVERQDVRVAERGDGLRLLREQHQPRGIGSECLEEDLDGHFALQPLVARAVDHARSARPDLLENLIVTQRLAQHREDRRRHVRSGGRRPVGHDGENRRRALVRARPVDACERGFHFARAREASRRVDLDGALDDTDERLLQIGAEILEARGLASRVRRAEAGNRLGVDGEVVGHEVEQQHPDAVDVAPDRRVGALKPLGGEIRQRRRRCPGAPESATSVRPAPKSISTRRPPCSRMTFWALTSP